MENAKGTYAQEELCATLQSKSKQTAFVRMAGSLCQVFIATKKFEGEITSLTRHALFPKANQNDFVPALTADPIPFDDATVESRPNIFISIGIDWKSEHKFLPKP